MNRLSAAAWLMISESAANRLKDYIAAAERNHDLLRTQKALAADWTAVSQAAQYFTRCALMGLDHAVRHEEFAEAPAAEDIENLPYAEAVEYLRKRSVLSKIDYDRLSAKLRFRAFTASRIADGDLLRRINGELVRAVEDGGGLKQFLRMTKDELLDKVGMGPSSGWYWETVYRTNAQTAYNAGRAMGFEKDPPLALELVAIDDARTSDICRPFAEKPVVLPYGDPFWQGHWPPLHLNCRSTIRGIYDPAELPEGWRKPSAADPAMEGFGAYPLDGSSWWEELESQVRRAKEYGVQGEIDAVRKMLERNWTTGRSVGAMARRFHVDINKDVRMPDEESPWYIKEGTEVTGVKVIAEGKGIRDRSRLVQQYPMQDGTLTSEKDWYKVRGTAILYNGDTKQEMKAEVHWYQCKNIGKVEFKFKRKID
ncbi:MAG: phage head morphogenesis protein [Treponemataceae bacterium]|nr:phage head morphogenesis protein [Treponemataceae bacterium]